MLRRLPAARGTGMPGSSCRNGRGGCAARRTLGRRQGGRASGKGACSCCGAWRSCGRTCHRPARLAAAAAPPPLLRSHQSRLRRRLQLPLALRAAARDRACCMCDCCRAAAGRTHSGKKSAQLGDTAWLRCSGPQGRAASQAPGMAGKE